MATAPRAPRDISGKESAFVLLVLLKRLARGPATFAELEEIVAEGRGGSAGRGQRTTYRYLQALREAGFKISRGPAYELLDHPLRGWRPRPDEKQKLADREAARRVNSRQTPGLSARRKEMGLTQVEAAKGAGITPHTLGKAERGKRVRLSTVQGLARALETSVAALTGEDATEDL